MRVLHVIARHNRAGTEGNVRHVVGWEHGRQHEVEVALLGSDESHDYPEGVRVHRLVGVGRGLSPLADLRAAYQLRRLLRRGSFDAVFTHKSKAGALGRLAARGQTRWVVHVLHMPSFGPGYPRFAGTVFKAIERLCARFTDQFLSVGNEIADLYRQAGIGSEETMHVIRSFVDVETFAEVRRASPERRAVIRASLDVPEGAAVLLTAGRLQKRKRHGLILERLAPILRNGEAVLLVAGEGPEDGDLRTLARKLEITQATHFLGHVSGIADLFAATDVLVHASEVEGVPQVVIQALAAGVPVVATEVEGLREVEGAPVRVSARDGSTLLQDVQDVLENPPAPVPVEKLAPWTLPEIDRSLERFYELLLSGERAG